MLPFHTVLCPLDFSEPSYKALHNAVEVASHFKAELLLLHVVTPAPGIPADPAYAFAGPEQFEEAVKKRGEEQLVIAAQNIGCSSFRFAFSGYKGNFAGAKAPTTFLPS